MTLSPWIYLELPISIIQPASEYVYLTN